MQRVFLSRHVSQVFTEYRAAQKRSLQSITSSNSKLKITFTTAILYMTKIHFRVGYLRLDTLKIKIQSC